MELEPLERMTKDIAAGARTLGTHEARFLVDAYYTMQKQRIQAGNQLRALSESGEPNDVIRWLNAQNEMLEHQVKRALGKYAEAHPIGEWALSVRGIGPVIAAGLLAHIDIRVAPTVGHIWRFAGLDPTVKWERGQKRPWNASLKVLCWKIGESFVKTKGHEEAVYGAIYEQRKAYETAKNDAGDYAAQAEATLAATPNHKQAAIYKMGKLPEGRIHMRAQRYAVKLFLAHLHEVWYRHEFGTAPPLPYAIAHLGHAHKIEPVTGPSESTEDAE